MPFVRVTEDDKKSETDRKDSEEKLPTPSSHIAPRRKQLKKLDHWSKALKDIGGSARLTKKKQKRNGKVNLTKKKQKS